MQKCGIDGGIVVLDDDLAKEKIHISTSYRKKVLPGQPTIQAALALLLPRLPELVSEG